MLTPFCPGEEYLKVKKPVCLRQMGINYTQQLLHVYPCSCLYLIVNKISRNIAKNCPRRLTAVETTEGQSMHPGRACAHVHCHVNVFKKFSFLYRISVDGKHFMRFRYRIGVDGKHFLRFQFFFSGSMRTGPKTTSNHLRISPGFLPRDLDDPTTTGQDCNPRK